MFAGAAREVVFSNSNVVRRINEDFIPVALKAAMVNNPPPGIEGRLYGEIGRSKPAPQGICTLNSAGKVLAWSLSFDDEASIPKFLDHVVGRYETSPDAIQPVHAERFHKFPSRKLPDVADSQSQLETPLEHDDEDRCPALPQIQPGTLVGRIVGRPLDDDGNLIADTIRQEHYMEARFEISVDAQRQLAEATKAANGKRFAVPESFVRSLIEPAFLGQLDVNPLGTIPGSENTFKSWTFFAEQVPSNNGRTTLRITGESDVEGAQLRANNPSGDGRMWEHRVTLHWQGYVDLRESLVTRMEIFAAGDERLRWGNCMLLQTKERDVEHLMAGHAIDLDCDVRFGLVAGDQR